MDPFTQQELNDLAHAAEFTARFYTAVEGDAPTEVQFTKRLEALESRFKEEAS